MARQGKYKGKRIVVTLDQDIYEQLVIDADENGLPVATRAKQLITIGLRENIQSVMVTEIKETPKEEISATNEKQSVAIDGKFKI